MRLEPELIAALRDLPRWTIDEGEEPDDKTGRYPIVCNACGRNLTQATWPAHPARNEYPRVAQDMWLDATGHTDVCPVARVAAFVREYEAMEADEVAYEPAPPPPPPIPHGRVAMHFLGHLSTRDLHVCDDDGDAEDPDELVEAYMETMRETARRDQSGDLMNDEWAAGQAGEPLPPEG